MYVFFNKIFVCMHKIDDLWMKTCLIKMKKKIIVSVKHFNFEQARILIKYYLVLKRAKKLKKKYQSYHTSASAR